VGHDRCVKCGRSSLVHHINEEGLCGYCQFSEWLATVDPKGAGRPPRAAERRLGPDEGDV